MRPIVLVLSATALIVASSQPIRADPIRVDQVSALSASPASAASPASVARSPEMVVGISGQLVALEVFLARWTNEGVTESRVAFNSASAPDISTMLANRAITPFGMPPGLARAPVHFDLASAQLQVIAGRLLALIEGAAHLAGRLNLPGPAMHAGGPGAPSSAAGGGGGAGAGAGGGVGLGQSAVAQADPTPEPTTIALVGSGLLLSAMGRRRMRRRQQANEK